MGGRKFPKIQKIPSGETQRGAHDVTGGDFGAKKAKNEIFSNGVFGGGRGKKIPPKFGFFAVNSEVKNRHY